MVTGRPTETVDKLLVTTKYAGAPGTTVILQVAVSPRLGRLAVRVKGPPAVSISTLPVHPPFFIVMELLLLSPTT